MHQMMKYEGRNCTMQNVKAKQRYSSRGHGVRLKVGASFWYRSRKCEGRKERLMRK